jgi:hypothetical protein
MAAVSINGDQASPPRAGFMVSEEVKDHFGDGEPRLRMLRKAKRE